MTARLVKTILTDRKTLLISELSEVTAIRRAQTPQFVMMRQRAWRRSFRGTRFGRINVGLPRVALSIARPRRHVSAQVGFWCDLCVSIGMAETSIHKRHGSLWLGLVVCLVGALSNVFYFSNPPVQAGLPWINLLMPIGGLVIVVFGLWRAYVRPEEYGGRVLGPVFAIVCLILTGGSTLGFFHARDVPASARAPRVGQKAPDFTLADTEGRMVSLSQLLAGSGEKLGTPKSVLLIFYRGYW